MNMRATNYPTSKNEGSLADQAIQSLKKKAQDLLSKEDDVDPLALMKEMDLHDDKSTMFGQAESHKDFSASSKCQLVC